MRILRSNLVPRMMVVNQLRNYPAAKAEIVHFAGVKHIFRQFITCPVKLTMGSKIHSIKRRWSCRILASTSMPLNNG
jgi:hypothetical protein